jgi:hypothetical protein
MRSDERLVLMPVLAPGSHAHPRIGGCFAEVAAILTTHQWTDHPACIPPVLAQIARRINDLTSPEARTDLAPLIPWAVCHPRPSADLTYDTTVTTAVIARARVELSGDPDLDPLLQQLAQQPRPRHILDRIGWRRAARHLVRAHLRSITSSTAGPARDARLRALLITAIDSLRVVEDLPPLPPPVSTPAIGAHLLPVTTHLAAVNGRPKLCVDPLLDRWPDWIREPWNRRLQELRASAATGSEDRPQQSAATRTVIAV